MYKLKNTEQKEGEINMMSNGEEERLKQENIQLSEDIQKEKEERGKLDKLLYE